MLSSMRMILGFLFLLLIRVHAVDIPKLEVTSQDDLMQIIPAAWINQAGFKMEDGVGFRSPEFANADSVFPFFPMYKSEYLGMSKKFIGVVVPERFLDLPEVSESNVTRVVGCDLHPSVKVQKACQTMRAMGLTPEFHKNRVYGLKVKGTGQVLKGRSVSIGIDLLPNFGSDDNTFDFREKSEWEISPLQNLANIFTGINSLISPPKYTEALEETLRLIPYLQSAMRHNQEYEVIQGGNLIPAKKSRDVEVSISDKTYVKIRPDLNEVTAELKDATFEYYRNIKEEQKWQNEMSVAYMAQLTPVIGDEGSNRLIQEVCDYLASAYGTATELWPRCRIMASLDANAFALPSGDIFISAGLIGIISDLDGVVHVLGHEIGHNIGRHLTKRFRLYGYFMPPMIAIGIAGNTFALAGGVGVLGPVTAATWFPQMIGASQLAGIGGTIVNLGVAAGLMYHSREHERQADRFGHEIAFLTGARAEGIERGWNEFKNYVEDYYGVRGNWLQSLLESHPRMGERLKNIQNAKDDFKKIPENRLPEDFYARYAHLHSDFKPYAHTYGKYVKQKLEAKNNKFAEYSKASLISPAGSCLMHALGGVD